MQQFIDICKKTQKQLRKHCRKQLLSLGYEVCSEKGFLYAAGDIPVLLVAHMDTVHKEKCKNVCVSKEGIIMSPEGIGGDDRCGVYMILEIIKELRCHVLFTEDEEIGGLGAKEFAESKYPKKVNVNYIIEFDRQGYDDSVYYWLDSPEFEEFISSFGRFKTNFGSYSDICDVAPAIGVAAVNLSCGYFNAHTLHEFVDFYCMLENIEAAKEIIKSESDVFEWYEEDLSYNYGIWNRYGKYSIYDDELYRYGRDVDDVVYVSEGYKNVILVEPENVKDQDGDVVTGEYFVVDGELNVYEVDIESGCGYLIPYYYVENIVYDNFDEFSLLCYN